MAAAPRMVAAPIPSEIDEATGAVLRFDGERVATFITSFNADDTASYHIVGTKGQIRVDPAFEHRQGPGVDAEDAGRPHRPQAHGQARPVRRAAAALLGLRAARPRARALRTRGPAGRPDRRSDLRVGSHPPRRPHSPYVESKWPSGRQRVVKPGLARPRLVKVQSASVD